MTTSFSTEKIRNLLNQKYNEQELRTFCFDNENFRDVFDKVADKQGKTEIISQIIEHADRKELFPVLLAWIEKSPTTEKPSSIDSKNSSEKLYFDFMNRVQVALNAKPEEKAIQIRALSLERFKKLDGNYKGEALKFLYDLELISAPEPVVDLSELDLSGADLSHLKLTKVKLGKVDLSGAILENCDLSYADLDHVNLRGANLTGTNLAGAKLDGVNFTEVTSLNKTNLSGAKLSDADLTGVDLTGANSRGAYFGWAKLKGVDLKGANLDTLGLTKDELTNFSGADLSEADLNGTNLRGVILKRAILRNTNLSNTNLRQRWVYPSGEAWGKEHGDNAIPDEEDIKLNELELRKTNLNLANLTKANLSEANLVGVSFREAYLGETDLTWADLDEVDFTEADLRGAIVTPEQLKQVKSLKHASMPNGEIYAPDFGSLIEVILGKTLATSAFAGLIVIGVFRGCGGIIAGIITGVICFVALMFAYKTTERVWGAQWFAFWGIILGALWGGIILGIAGGIAGAIVYIIMVGLQLLLNNFGWFQSGSWGVIAGSHLIQGMITNMTLFSKFIALVGMIWGTIEGKEEATEYSWSNRVIKQAVLYITTWGTLAIILGSMVIWGLGNIIGSSEIASVAPYVIAFISGLFVSFVGIGKTYKHYRAFREKEYGITSNLRV